MYKKILMTVLPCFFVFFAAAQQQKKLPTKKTLVTLIDSRLKDASAQYRYFTTQVNDMLFPKTIKKDGTLESSKSSWWCSGFFPGTLGYLNEYQNDETLSRAANHYLGLLEKEQYNKGTHDLGFMMYCSFGNAQRLAPNKKYEQILVQSARSLATRYSPKTGSIRSWNSKDPTDFLVIIDNMMNLELLFYATKVTGDSSFYKIAISHADKTMENHFRADYSSFHVVNYNAETGAVKLRRTQQGASDGSAWARGQAWALYGYTLMFRETKQQKYLDLANNIAAFITKHPNMPADGVPYWDFNAPNIPNALRDASSAAIMASAFIELATYNHTPMAKKYLGLAETMIKTLSGAKYQNAYKEKKGFLLKHSVGSLPQNSEVDVPLTYADYYYIEAMLRYKQLALKSPVVAAVVAKKDPKTTTFVFEKGINISAWLSQTSVNSGATRLKYFTQKDLQELASLGFDHIRLPFNENQLYSLTGDRNEETFTIIHNVIDWCKQANMRIILDCHQTYDHDFSKFSKITLFKEPAAQDRFEVLWQKLGDEFGKYPNDLVAYEILNEPNALDHKSWNLVANKIVKVIRKKEPARIILLGSNKANRVTTFPDLQIPPNDPNIILSFHFYYPYLITHFNSNSYKSLKVIKGPLVYPGQLVSDSIVRTLDEDAKKVLAKHNGVFNKQVLYEMMLPAIDKAKAAGLRIHCGEFGTNFQYGDNALLTRYMKDVVSIFKENNIPFTYWGYRKQFGVFDDGGKIKSQEYLDAIMK